MIAAEVRPRPAPRAGPPRPGGGDGGGAWVAHQRTAGRTGGPTSASRRDIIAGSNDGCGTSCSTARRGAEHRTGRPGGGGGRGCRGKTSRGGCGTTSMDEIIRAIRATHGITHHITHRTTHRTALRQRRGGHCCRCGARHRAAGGGAEPRRPSKAVAMRVGVGVRIGLGVGVGVGLDNGERTGVCVSERRLARLHRHDQRGREGVGCSSLVEPIGGRAARRVVRGCSAGRGVEGTSRSRGTRRVVRGGGRGCVGVAG